jgi:hypothetical protein
LYRIQPFRTYTSFLCLNSVALALSFGVPMLREHSREVFLVVAGGNPFAERYFEDTIQRKRTLQKVRTFLPIREIQRPGPRGLLPVIIIAIVMGSSKQTPSIALTNVEH